MNTTTLHVCASCGSPVELSHHDEDRLPEWERHLGQPLVIHCLECAGDYFDRGLKGAGE